MQTFYKNRPATVWQISKTNQRPNWVQEAFDQNYLTWLDDRLRIVMAGLYSPMIPSLQNEKADIFHDHGVMFGITSIGYLGDYLDVTNHRVVTRKNNFQSTIKSMRQVLGHNGYLKSNRLVSKN